MAEEYCCYQPIQIQFDICLFHTIGVFIILLNEFETFILDSLLTFIGLKN